MRSSTPIVWHSSLMLVKSTEDRYLSPKLHKMTTISLPAISGLVATRRAATTAAPDEIPQKMPSSFAKRFAISIESSLLTWVYTKGLSMLNLGFGYPRSFDMAAQPPAQHHREGWSISACSTKQLQHVQVYHTCYHCLCAVTLPVQCMMHSLIRHFCRIHDEIVFKNKPLCCLITAIPCSCKHC